MSIYLDASFLIPTLVEEKDSAVVNAYLNAVEDELLVSEFAAGGGQHHGKRGAVDGD